MKQLLIAIAVAGMLIPAIASAELNYNAVQVGYAKTSESGVEDLHEYSIGVSFSVNNDVFIDGQFSTGRQASGTAFGDITGTAWAIGAGYHAPINNNVDIIISGGISRATVEIANNSQSGNGYNFGVGIRGEITPRLEGSLSGGYLSMNSNSSTTTGTGISAGLGFNVTPQFQLIADIGSNSFRPQNGSSYSTSTLGIGARLFF